MTFRRVQSSSNPGNWSSLVAKSPRRVQAASRTWHFKISYVYPFFLVETLKTGRDEIPILDTLWYLRFGMLDGICWLWPFSCQQHCKRALSSCKTAPWQFLVPTYWPMGGMTILGGNVTRWMAETWAVCLRFLGGHTFKIGKPPKSMAETGAHMCTLSHER